jgi:hypothetical protein
MGAPPTFVGLIFWQHPDLGPKSIPVEHDRRDPLVIVSFFFLYTGIDRSTGARWIWLEAEQWPTRRGATRPHGGARVAEQRAHVVGASRGGGRWRKAWLGRQRWARVRARGRCWFLPSPRENDAIAGWGLCAQPSEIGAEGRIWMPTQILGLE